MPSGSGSGGGGSKGSPASKRNKTASTSPFGGDYQTTNPNAPNYSPF